MWNINSVLDSDDFDGLSKFLSAKVAADFISLQKCGFEPTDFNNIRVSSSRTDDNKVSVEVTNMYDIEFSPKNFNEQFKMFKYIYCMVQPSLNGYFSYRSSMIDVLINVNAQAIEILHFTDCVDVFNSMSSSISGREINFAMATNITQNVFTILKMFSDIADIRDMLFDILVKNGLISDRREVILQNFTPSQARLLALYYVVDHIRNHGTIDIFDYKPLDKELEQFIFLNELAAVMPYNMEFKFGIFRAGRNYIDIDNSFEVIEICNYLNAMTERLKNLTSLYPPKYKNCYGVGNYTDKCFMKMSDNLLYLYHSYSKSYFNILLHNFGEIASKTFSQVVITFKSSNSSNSSTISVFQNGKLQYLDDSVNILTR